MANQENGNKLYIYPGAGCGAPPPGIPYQKTARLTTLSDPEAIFLAYNHSPKMASQAITNWENDSPTDLFIAYPIIDGVVDTNQPPLYIHPSDVDEVLPPGT